MVDRNHKILIIDDDPAALETLGLLSSKFFKNITKITNIEDALIFIKNNKVDLILSDYNLGSNKMSGLDLYSFCMNQPKVIPFILISGRADDVQFEVLEAGSVHPPHMLNKPFKLNELTQLLTELIKD